ncbi:MAG: hypothetical protein KG003_08340 [Bacteroidetes bacterium]|nr:hypothetical protein [Bacteroidota bacterium]
MKASGQLNIQAVTIEFPALKQLVDTIVSYLKDKKYRQVNSIVVFQGKTYKEEYKYDNFPEFQNFKEGLELIDITISATDKLEINITLSSNEINPLGPIFSKVSVDSDDRIITNGLIEEISSFFKKRSNYHNLLHTYGIPISIAVSYLIYISISYFFSDFILKLNFKRDYLIFFFLILSFPIKKYLRWLFPYVFFVGENRKRTFQRTLFYVVLTGLLTNLIFLLVQGKLQNLIGQ